ncbi:hypothetical protein P4T89_03155 [Bacillus nakamurai]|uniref:Uncharacterized protein n=1 Tax=Bacillus nakamurai TaxID=1793963 RepID=A0A150F9H5_9BACI|nr:hypothetical protein [Bacillus nakamurai]KXZ21755.1 hypothetical protein AXI58_12470 [Bacillus nakamurai]MED1226633.1 hypothetical protein [Bacillus nakamurai]
MHTFNWSEHYDWFNKDHKEDQQVMALIRDELTYDEVKRLYSKGFYLKSKERNLPISEREIRHLLSKDDKYE